MPTSDEGVTPADVLARIENSPYAELLHDEHKLERTLIELMAASGYPILAEIGRELQQGHLSWQGIGGIATYREVLDTGFATMQRIDLEEIAAGLANLDVSPASAAPDTWDEDEETELFRSLDEENHRWSGR